MVTFAEQGLLKNLDEYAAAFGWDEWPVPQLNQNRVAEDGTRGSGSLYAMGLNYSLTGIFYNKELAAQIGMTEPPQTLAEFDEILARAKEAGLLPIMQWGSAKSGMGLAFPLQEPDGCVRSGRANQRLDLPEAWRDDRYTGESVGCSTPAAVDRERLLPA